MENLTGSCLCGKISIKTEAAKTRFDACHCGMCRKWGGGPYLAIDCGPKMEVTSGKEFLGVFNSSEWAERAFCKECGTHIYYYLKDTDFYGVPVGLLDQGSTEFKFEEQIFIDKKPAYYEFANETENLTEAEVFAKYAPPAD